MTSYTRSRGHSPLLLKGDATVSLERLHEAWQLCQSGKRPPLAVRDELKQGGHEWFLRYLEAILARDAELGEPLFLEALERADSDGVRIYLLLQSHHFIGAPSAAPHQPFLREIVEYFATMNEHRLLGIEACSPIERVINGADMMSLVLSASVANSTGKLDWFALLLKALSDEYRFVLPMGEESRQLALPPLMGTMNLLALDLLQRLKTDPNRWRELGLVYLRAGEDYMVYQEEMARTDRIPTSRLKNQLEEYRQQLGGGANR